MARSALRYGVLVLAAGLFATCGGGSDSSDGTDPGDTSGSGGGGSQDQSTAVTCNSLEPSDCGGDVAGSWSLDSLCGTSSISVARYLPAECDGTSVDLEPASSTGTSTFSDGSFTMTATLNFAASVRLVAVCIQAIVRDLGLECASLGPALATQQIQATCVLDGNDCQCDGTYSETVNETGTYTVSGNQLTLTPASSIDDPQPEPTTTTFCVREGYLVGEVAPPVSGAQPFHSVLEKM